MFRHPALLLPFSCISRFGQVCLHGGGCGRPGLVRYFYVGPVHHDIIIGGRAAMLKVMILFAPLTSTPQPVLCSGNNS